MHTKEQKKIYNTYDAAGIKLRKSAGSTTTDYIGNFIYENGTLKYIITDYGKIIPNINTDDTTYTRNYNLTDHLGNVRVTFNDNGEILQEDSYYPFGMTMNGLNYQNVSDEDKNLYLYNGKELNEDFGLEWYDFGARFYDAQLGRWFVADPMAEQRTWLSPYQYAQNNPILRLDPNGMLDELIITGVDADKATQVLSNDSKLNLSRNSQTGKVDISNLSDINYNDLNKKDKRLYDIVMSNNKTVNLQTTRSNYFTKRDGSKGVLFVGAYDGQKMTKLKFNDGIQTLAGSDEIEIEKYDGYQAINMNQIMSLDKNKLEDAGMNIFHEIDESFSAMEIVQETSSEDPSRNVYNAAHNRAVSHDKDYKSGNYKHYMQTGVKTHVYWIHPNPSAKVSDNGWIKLN